MLIRPGFRLTRHLRVLCAAVLAAAVMSAFVSAPDARAEGEDQNPSLTGMDYERWISILSAEAAGGGSQVAVWCRYLGSSANRDAAGEIQVQTISRGYLLPAEAAKRLGWSAGKVESPAHPSSELKAFCPSLPDLQPPGWHPVFPQHAEIRRLDPAARELGADAESSQPIAFELSNRALERSGGLCDDNSHHLRTLFAGHSELQKTYCAALLEREFSRGIKRCLWVVNQALNRAYDSHAKSGQTDFVSWPKEGPTPSYCPSLLMVGGSRFEQLLTENYDCESPFQTLLFSDYKRDQKILSAVLKTVFGSAQARVEPVIAKINPQCLTE